MATDRVRLNPDKPPELSPETMVRLDAMTEDEVEQNARTDKDNPPLTEAELEIVRIARFVQSVRRTRKMTQVEFARVYGMAVARLRDWEQGRFKPDAMTLAYLATIAHEPEAVDRALAKQRSAA